MSDYPRVMRALARSYAAGDLSLIGERRNDWIAVIPNDRTVYRAPGGRAGTNEGVHSKGKVLSRILAARNVVGSRRVDINDIAHVVVIISHSDLGVIRVAASLALSPEIWVPTYISGKKNARLRCQCWAKNLFRLVNRPAVINARRTEGWEAKR
jgi:hypothetical protein